MGMRYWRTFGAHVCQGDDFGGFAETVGVRGVALSLFYVVEETLAVLDDFMATVGELWWGVL